LTTDLLKIYGIRKGKQKQSKTKQNKQKEK
jgi:hypothetical protein